MRNKYKKKNKPCIYRYKAIESETYGINREAGGL